jgi:CBS domain-containing protein
MLRGCAAVPPGANPMNVEACMTRDPKTCTPADTLQRAAQIMWDHDCGAVPVVDEKRKLVGIVTDRDVCMAGYTQGRPLQEIRVEWAMAKTLFTVSPTDGLDEVLRSMSTRLVRRLPVVDGAGVLVGIVSLADVVCRAAERKGGRHAKAEHVLELVHALSKRRKPAAQAAQAAQTATGTSMAAAGTAGGRKDVLVPKSRTPVAAQGSSKKKR